MLDWKNIDLRWMIPNTIPDDAFYHRIYTVEDMAYLKRIIENLKASDKNIFIHHTEGFPSIVEGIYKELIVPFNLTEDKICIISSDINIQDTVCRFAEQYNKKSIKSIFQNYWLYWTADSYFQNQHKINNVERIVDYKINNTIDKTFICLNRRFAIHRFVLLALLDYFDLLKHGHVSNDLSHASQVISKNLKRWNLNLFKVISDENFQSVDQIVKASIPYILYHHSNDPLITNIFSNYENVQNIVDLKIDSLGSRPEFFGDGIQMQDYSLNDELDILYTNSMLEVITESWHFYSKYSSPYQLKNNLNLTYENSTVFTQKIWRPVIYKQPFMIVGVPNYLRDLKKLGYKTFSPFIDESYDTESDDSKRLLMIVKELKRLTMLSKEEKTEFIKNTLPICQHNFNVIKEDYQTFSSNL